MFDRVQRLLPGLVQRFVRNRCSINLFHVLNRHQILVVLEAFVKVKVLWSRSNVPKITGFQELISHMVDVYRWIFVESVGLKNELVRVGVSSLIITRKTTYLQRAVSWWFVLFFLRNTPVRKPRWLVTISQRPQLLT